ncbi:MAG: transporter substrate-binding domain-containing protein [Deltaproteobacteria bacterium]|nr:transporter substrate-binding domain-containing protein [Deltaproteobacteria bacterium]
MKGKTAQTNSRHGVHRRILSMRRLQLFLIALIFLFLAVTAVRADNRTVTVGVYENAPKVFTSEDGHPSGIFIDIIEFIAKNEGWNLNYVSGTWAEGLDRLAKGEIDLMPDVAYTVDREKQFSFHKVQVLSSWFQAYARKGSGIQSILDLNGKRIAVLEGSVQQEAFNRFSQGFGLNIDLIAVPDYKTMFEIVADGKADAGITNKFYGVMHARKYGLVDTAVVFEPSALFFATTKGTHKQLLNTIDNYMRDMKKDPQSIYYRSLKRWTSEEVRFKLPAWLQILGLAAGVALLVSFGASVVLKHQVNARTHELQQINREMEQRIIKRTEELAEAMKNAQAADRIKSAFLATMSHELRTPLNSIIGFSGILLQEMAGPLNEEQKKQLRMVCGSAEHLLDLINDVLDISKIEAGQLTLASEPFDLRAAFTKAINTATPMAEKKGLRLESEIDSKVGTITSDRRRVEQILLNLLSNAIKFTDHGKVRAVCSLQDNRVLIRVMDTGIGIKRKDLGKLFMPFQQVDSGIDRQREGTGLGLSISKKLVEMLGGTIKVESKWGKGSTFRFTLPVERKSK